MNCDFKTREEFQLQSIPFGELPGWEDDAHLESLQAMDPTTVITTNVDAKRYFEQHFTAHKVNDNQEGLFTGYFEPMLNGSRTKTAQYNVPIYNRPPELILIEDMGLFRDEFAGTRIAGVVSNGTLKPFATRGEIMAGALAGRGLEILWVDSEADAFFMAVQGSGRVRLPGGALVKLAYDGANGHPYTTIGKVMLEKGYIDKADVSMASIKAWLNAHPVEAAHILSANKSYIFFKEVESAGDNPIGSCGLPLTPGRSLAVDKRYVPLGTPVWLDIAHPESAQKIQRLMIAQDSGSAIKGTVRGDYYWGTGDGAGQMAGKMKSRGNFYILKAKC